MRNTMASGHYERLTPRERLALLTEAKARGDQTETNRLYDTAPMQLWRIVDYEFIRGRDAMCDLVTAVCVLLNEDIGKLHIIDKMQKMIAPIMQMATLETVPKLLNLMGENAEEQAARGILEARSKTSRRWGDNHNGAQAAGHEEEHRLSQAEWAQIVDRFTGEARGTVGDMIRGLSDEVTDEAAAMLAGFDRLTRRLLGLDALTVLRAWAPPMAEAVEKLRIIDHTPDAKSVDLWAQIWAEGWNTRLGIKTTPDQTAAMATHTVLDNLKVQDKD